MADVSISMGLDAQQLYSELQQTRHAIEAAATHAKTQADKISKEAGAGFGGLGKNLIQGAAALGIESQLEKVVHHFSEIQIISERFGVSTTILQQMAQAAETLHIPLESVAKAFKFIDLAREKALADHGGPQAKAFEHAGVGIEELKSADPAELFTKVGSSALSAVDGMAIFKKSFSEARQLAEGLAQGDVKLGTHIVAPEDVAKIHQADLALTNLKQTLTQIGGQIIGTFTKNFQGSLAEFVLNMRAVDSEVNGVMNAIKTIVAANIGAVADLFGALGKAMKAALHGHFGEAVDDIKTGVGQAKDASAAGLTEAGKQISKGHEEAKAFHEEAGKTAAEITAPEEEVKKRKVNVEELEEKGDAKEAKKEEKEAAKEAKAEAKEVATEQKDALKSEQKQRKLDKLDSDFAKNPTGLSLADYATKGSGHVAALAQQATREEAIAKQRQLVGDFKGATEHQNKAEQLKKSLGLPSKEDAKDSVKQGIDDSEVMKQIRDNTANSGTNK